MVTYVYRCPDCGDVDVRRAMGQATPQLACPHCNTDARRLYTSPGTRLIDASVARALDGAGASAETPQTVAAVPPGNRTPRSRVAHPLHARLPRP